MAISTSLLDWLLDLLRDPDARAAFLADPEGYLNECGFGDVSADDVHDALTLISDNDHHSHSDHGVHYPPPHHYGHGENAAHYLNNYITNNYTIIDDHSTNIDNSVHQRIDTDGGDFSQSIDNDPVVASGDHSVAAGDDIRDSTVTTGHNNVVGDDNQAVTGDDNTTSFGSGDATNADLRGTHLDHGGALSVGADASGYHSDNDTVTSVRNSGDGDTAVNTAGSHGYADQHTDQSHTDNSEHHTYEDNSSVDSHDDVNSHNDTRFEDSHNVDVHHA